MNFGVVKYVCKFLECFDILTDNKKIHKAEEKKKSWSVACFKHEKKIITVNGQWPYAQAGNKVAIPE